MANELMNMEGFKGGPAQAFGPLPQDTDSLSDGIGSSYGLIKYKGKVWSLVKSGEQFTFVKQDGYPLEYLDFVILGQARNKSKSYFPNWVEGSTEAPLCASIDGITPDPGVPQKQSDTCAMCPRNVWHNTEDGKKKRDCADYKRIAILLMPSQTKALLGEPLMEPVFLRVPGASLQGIAQMGDQTLKQGYPYWTYVTRADFDPTESYPKMRFKAIQALTDAEAPIVLKLRDDPLIKRILGEDQVRVAAITHQPPPAANAVDTGLVASAQGTAPGTATGMTQTFVSDDPASAIKAALAADREKRIAAIRAEGGERPAPQTLELKANPPTQPSPPAALAPAAAPAQATAPLTGLVDTGLGSVQVASPSKPAPAAPAQQTVADTGDPTASDADMDARIAALMPQS